MNSRLSPPPLYYPPQSMVEIWNRAWHMTCQNWKASLLIMLVPTFFSTISTLISNLISHQSTLMARNPAFILSTLVLSLIVFILFIPRVASIWAATALLGRLYFLNLIQPESPTLQRALSDLKKMGWPFVRLSLIQVGCILGFSTLFVVLLFVGLFLLIPISALLGLKGGTNNIPMILSFILVGGFAFFMLLLGIFAVQVGFVLFPVFSLLNPEPGQASTSMGKHFRASAQLLWRNWQRLLGFMVCFFILYWVLEGTLMGPLLALGFFEIKREGLMLQPTSIPIHIKALWSLGINLINMIVLPLTLSAFCLFWYDCRVRRQGLDLKLWLQHSILSTPANPAIEPLNRLKPE